MLGQKNVTRLKATGIFLALSIAFCSLAPPSLAQESQQGTPPPVKLKSESSALTLSVVGTTVPIPLIFLAAAASGPGGDADFLAWAGISSLAIGPSIGYFYADSMGRAWSGIGFRAIGLAGIFGGGGGFLSVAGAGIFIVSTVCDLVQVKSAVRRHNLRVKEKGLALVPVFSPRSKTVGLQVQFSF